ncbi:MAG: hypothetical protein NTV31_01005 [Bacteroidia bacterium]|nr:hypothetical protein [Bacteroidia bacterium]
MSGHIVRKFLVILIFIAPVCSFTGCKKQPKCGCDGDIVLTLDKEPAKVYFNEGGTNITFTRLADPTATFYFCNPGQMFPKLADSKTGDILLVSGTGFWECNYVYQSSNYSYQPYYKVYMLQATDLTVNLYGKKK